MLKVLTVATCHSGTSLSSAQRMCFSSILLICSCSSIYIYSAKYWHSTILSHVSRSSTPLFLVYYSSLFPSPSCSYIILPGVSTDSKFSHFAWATQTRKEGGLGPDLKLPLVADRNMSISREYGVLLEDEGIALRGLFIIDPKGILR